jgi:hypothetical protein
MRSGHVQDYLVCLLPRIKGNQMAERQCQNTGRPLCARVALISMSLVGKNNSASDPTSLTVARR